MEPTKLIFAAELAEIIGQSERTARGMLAELERKHKAKAVVRVGRERATTWPALERFTALQCDAREPSFDLKKLIATTRRVLSELAGLGSRISELESDLSELRIRVAEHVPRACTEIA